MWKRAGHYKDILGGWKTYCAWGDVPVRVGLAARLRLRDGVPARTSGRSATSTRRSRRWSRRTRASPCPASTSAARRRATSDPPPRRTPDVRFMIYHSGYDIFESGVPVGGQAEGPYPGRRQGGLVRLARSTRSSSRCARTTRTRPGSSSRGKTFGNVPNVWAELGSVWREHISDPERGRSPARQAHHARRAQADRLGHRQPLVRLTAPGDHRAAQAGVHERGEGALQPAVRARRRRRGSDAAGALARRGRSATGSSAVTRPPPTTSIPTSSGRGSSATTSTRCASPTTSRTSASSPRARRCARTRCTARRTRREVLKELKEGPWAP